MNKIQQDFSNAAKTYDAHAHLQQQAADELLARLEFLSLKPRTILDLGCGTGTLLRKLSKRYPKAQLIGLDLSLAMCAKTKPYDVVCADIHQLPLASNSIDLVVSNFTFQWCEDLPQVFSQINRVATPEAVFLFSTVGAGSLFELQQSWASVNDTPRVKSFVDMHEIGDALYQAGWQEPVMDIERITHYYPEVKDLLHEFKQLGVTNKEPTRIHGLTGKNAFAQFVAHYERRRTPQGIPLSWEVVYGYARAPKGIKFTP